MSWRAVMVIALGLVVAQNALAQQTHVNGADYYDGRDNAPATRLPPLPQGAAPATNGAVMVTSPSFAAGHNNTVAQYRPGQAGFIPALPPSTPCKPEDAIGIWKLSAVYENPPGKEIDGFKSNPAQYLLLDKDTTYKTYVSNVTNEPLIRVIQHLRDVAPPTLQQYLVAEGGMMYFYNAGNVVDSKACFIVASKPEAVGGRQNDFTIGEMIIMPPKPPEGQSATRLIKVYQSSIESDPNATNVIKLIRRR